MSTGVPSGCAKCRESADESYHYPGIHGSTSRVVEREVNPASSMGKFFSHEERLRQGPRTRSANMLPDSALEGDLVDHPLERAT